MNRTLLTLTFLLTALVLACGSTVVVTPESGSASSDGEFDHSHRRWEEIVSRHATVDGGVGVFDYAAVVSEPESLDAYLASLSAVQPSTYRAWSKEQQLAFLINAYNALTVKLILEHYPVDSIKDIGGLFSGPWKQKFFRLLGEIRHLDDIEHGIIRRDFDEPRIHFAVNCAAVGCPPLREKAYVADRLEQQLEASTRAFLQDPRRNRHESDSNTLRLSSIFDWYGSDFDSVPQFVASKMELSEAQRNQITQGDVRIRYLDYDWSLNDMPKK